MQEECKRIGQAGEGPRGEFRVVACFSRREQDWIAKREAWKEKGETRSARDSRRMDAGVSVRNPAGLEEMVGDGEEV